MALVPGVEDLAALELLVSVVELGSLSQAGAHHGVSQPAVSTRIARLEKRMGIALVHRSTSGCTPTPLGRVVVEWASQVLSEAHRMGRAVSALRSSANAVSIAASLTIAEQMVPSWLGVLSRSHPTVRVRVIVANSTAVVAAVRADEVALGFVETNEPIHGLHHREIGRDQLVVVVAADHRWTHRRTALRSHHLAETRLVSREIGSGTRAVFEAALSARGLAMAEPILELSSSVAIRNAVAAGVGPTVISELAVADDVASGRLVAVPVADLDLSRAFTAVWRSNPAPALLEWLCPSGETVRPRADQ